MIYYHISNIDLGPSPILKAQIPESSVISIEGDTPRVCFSKSILGCIWSLDSSDCTLFEGLSNFILYNKNKTKLDSSFPNRIKVKNPVVYYTNKRLKLPPLNVSDFKETGEMWSLKDIQVNKLGYLDLRKSLLDNKTHLSLEHGVIISKYRKESIFFGSEYDTIKASTSSGLIRNHRKHKKN